PASRGSSSRQQFHTSLRVSLLRAIRHNFTPLRLSFLDGPKKFLEPSVNESFYAWYAHTTSYNRKVPSAVRLWARALTTPPWPATRRPLAGPSRGKAATGMALGRPIPKYSASDPTAMHAALTRPIVPGEFRSGGLLIA